MNVDHFVSTNQPTWREMEGLLNRVERSGPASLDAAELREFARLYRKTADDLAYARTYFVESQVTEFLNHLVGRAHPLLYIRRRRRLIHAVTGFFRRDFPRAFRASWRAVAAAAGIFLLAGLVGYFGTWSNPTMARSVLPAWLIQKVDAGEMWTRDIYAFMPGEFLSARIATNNITVTFLLFAMGMTAGLGTVYMLAYNGFLLGCAGGLCRAAGMDGPFFSFIAAHGPLELFIIFLAGGAGLELGMAIVAPGQRSRSDALRRRGGQAVRLILGGVPLLVVAGLVEGFISGAGPLWLVGGLDVGKGLVGLALVGAVLAYLVLPGRKEAGKAGAMPAGGVG